jgi:L-lactate dehydrogenase complex protein LldG
MSSREEILAAVKANQPGPSDPPPDYAGPAGSSVDAANAGAEADLTSRFITVLEAIGGAAFLVSGYDRVATILREQFPDAKRIVSNCPQLRAFAAGSSAAAALSAETPHSFETVDLAILPAHFGVAENGACWVTEAQMIQRVLPFITQNLALVLSRTAIVATMHQAYDRIAVLEAAAAAVPASPAAAASDPNAAGAMAPSDGFATFIAGPSKTADIEQSLVLGAHGPRSLTVFLLDDHLSDAGFF